MLAETQLFFVHNIKKIKKTSITITRYDYNLTIMKQKLFLSQFYFTPKNGRRALSRTIFVKQLDGYYIYLLQKLEDE
jgi:hypothetical protein